MGTILRQALYFTDKVWYNSGMIQQIVAFDVGDRRVGVAFSDPFGDYAKIAASRGAVCAVVGLPLNEDGTESVQSEKTRRFAAALERAGLAIVFEDERYTTRAARSDLLEMGVSRKKDKKKKQVDSIAAAYILESYLAKIKQGE